MESVIKKIFSGNSDEEVHSEFIKFSRGKFENKYLINAKKQKDKWNIKTSNEFANFFVRKCLEKASEDVKITGIIVSTFNIQNDVQFEILNVKQFAGVKRFVINCVTNAKNILDLMNKYPRAFYALSFSVPGCVLKIKAKAPKSTKPSTNGVGDPKADFCSLKTNDKSIVEDLFFDQSDFNEIAIKHTIQIDEIILPQGVSDPVQLRELAKRKGKIIRDIKINGNSERKEKEFEA